MKTILPRLLVALVSSRRAPSACCVLRFSLIRRELSWGLFSRLAGVKLTLVHYKGGAPANIALVSGEVDLIWGGFASSMSYIKAGKARVLGISTAERSRLLPDVPTVAEQGAPGFTYLQWIGIAVPAATPSAIVARLNEELVKVARDADILRRLHDDGHGGRRQHSGALPGAVPGGIRALAQGGGGDRRAIHTVAAPGASNHTVALQPEEPACHCATPSRTTARSPASFIGRYSCCSRTSTSAPTS